MRLQLFIQDDHVVIDNGILQITVTKPGGLLKIIQYSDIDNLLELHNKDLNGGFWDLNWSEPGSTGTRGKFDTIEGTSFNVVLANEEQIELSFRRTWDPSLKGDHSPLFIDTRFVMLKDVSGFYSYAIFEHLEDMPAFNLNTTRIAFMLNRDKFKYMAIADNIQRYMPDLDDRLPGRGEALAYPEAVRLINPIEPEFIGEVDDKYEYSCENKDNRVHGWICMDPPVGFWQITPSNEFRTGGPLKQDLTSHVNPTTLAIFLTSHYAGEDLVVKFGSGEIWKKVLGPVFTYLNSESDHSNALSLWNDAKEQMNKEVKNWPYNFPVSEDFPKSNQRGKVKGRLLVKDRYICCSDLPAKDAYVGLALPGDVGSWQRECKGYQFWNTADEEGNFTIENVRAGKYDIYAWVPGFIGDYKYNAEIAINPGSAINLGDLTYEPPRDGPTLWEIGIPDRSAAEFSIPDPDPKYINKLYVNHPDRKIGDNSYKETTWQIKFEVLNVDHTKPYKLRLALASAHHSELQVRVNDGEENPALFSSGTIGWDNAIARHGIHGIYWVYSVDIQGSQLLENDYNIIYLTQTKNTSPFQGIMYDYIRLEAPPSHL